MKDEIIETQELYVSLSALMDFRYGALHVADPAIAYQLLEKGYYKRTSDDWVVLDPDLPESFLKRYSDLMASHSYTVMKASMVTHLAFEFKSIISAMIDRVIATGETSEINITVNCESWTLDKDEISTLRVILLELFGLSTNITIINVPLISVTPRLLSKFSAIFMYDFREWLSLHMASFDAKQPSPIARIDLFAPAFTFDTLFKDEQNATVKTMVDNVGLTHEEALDIASKELEFFTLVTWFEPKEFSMALPVKI